MDENSISTKITNDSSIKTKVSYGYSIKTKVLNDNSINTESVNDNSVNGSIKTKVSYGYSIKTKVLNDNSINTESLNDVSVKTKKKKTKKNGIQEKKKWEQTANKLWETKTLNVEFDNNIEKEENLKTLKKESKNSFKPNIANKEKKQKLEKCFVDDKKHGKV